MKQTIAILLFSLSALQALNAQPEAKENNFLLDNDELRTDILSKRLAIYKAIPTNLWQWDYGNISTISFNDYYSWGEFKTVDDFSKDYGYSFESESIQKMTEKGWAFYGKFAFSNSNHKEAIYNMFYTKSEVGSPFRMVSERLGNFKVKHYGIAGGLSKKLNDKLAVGASINYAGDLYFRTRDTRNEQYNLTIDLIGSLSYKLDNYRTLALGVAYYYHKATNTYSNDFKTSGSEYYLYSLNGLGDFNKAEISDQVIITDKNPKFLISYFSGQKNKLNLLLSFYPGNNQWNNKITSENSLTPEKFYKYEYLDNNFTGTYLISENNYDIFNNVSANFITGNGYEFRGGAYQKTYLYEGLNAAYSTDLYRKRKSLFYKSMLGINFETIRKKDMTYAHEMKYTNVLVSAKTGYLVNVNSNNKLAIDAGANYKLNLSYLHEVVAAGSKPYTTNMAYNEMAYNTADVIETNFETTWFGKIGKLKAEYRLQYSYINPLKIRIKNNYSQLETDNNKNNISARISLYF